MQHNNDCCHATFFVNILLIYAEMQNDFVDMQNERGNHTSYLKRLCIDFFRKLANIVLLPIYSREIQVTYCYGFMSIVVHRASWEGNFGVKGVKLVYLLEV